MNQAMINSAVTLGQLQHKMDTTGHNLANMNTSGYKRRDVSFSDLLFQQVNNQSSQQYETGRQTPAGIRTGTGGAVAQTAVRFEQGSISQSGRDLDVAITEPGYYFELVPGENGERRFTRDGAFYLSPNPNNQAENFLVDRSGEYIQSQEGQPITIPGSFRDLRVSETGEIQVTLNDGENTEVTAGQLQLVSITKPQLLESHGGNYYGLPDLDELNLEIDDVLTESAGTQVFQQGALEMSNVDMAKEMNDMLQTQRGYQFNTRAISITDEMMGLVNNIR
ncbi:flagellar hook-basal body protein [Bacillus sp. H-16]|uniref:flagellar hook-basal body protein n=1 Tax=Alteribacter salitolerans TaxID=2912333 RepID=UPI001964ADEC|nr:flagellar hook-basal body protein [Alteribacter salitolerans]MBM7095615.1 flagellar hook-basal body protein [Alteribacter salitolerans]